jgi:hypothetical protein
VKYARPAIKPMIAAVVIRPLPFFLLVTGLACVQQALASQVQVIECAPVITSGVTPSKSITGHFIIRRHIEEAEPFETTETDLWSQGKFVDEGYFEVTVFPLEGDPVSERSTSVQTTILDSALLGDEYQDEALTMEKKVSIEGYTLDSISLAFGSEDGTALDTHLEVPLELDREAWDPYPGCSVGCFAECAVTWRVPGDPVICQGQAPGSFTFCTTGTFINKVVSVTHEAHEHEHGAGFTMNAGLNDAWVNAEAPFQGLFITVYPTLNIVFVAWFTFDSEIPVTPPHGYVWCR